MLNIEQMKINQEGVNVLLKAARKIVDYVDAAKVGASEDCSAEEDATELRVLAEDAAKLFLSASKIVGVTVHKAQE